MKQRRKSQTPMFSPPASVCRMAVVGGLGLALLLPSLAAADEVKGAEQQKGLALWSQNIVTLVNNDDDQTARDITLAITSHSPRSSDDQQPASRHRQTPVAANFLLGLFSGSRGAHLGGRGCDESFWDSRRCRL